MYGKICSIEFFNIMPPYDKYLMYIKVVELEQLDLVAKDYF